MTTNLVIEGMHGNVNVSIISYYSNKQQNTVIPSIQHLQHSAFTYLHNLGHMQKPPRIGQRTTPRDSWPHIQLIPLGSTGTLPRDSWWTGCRQQWWTTRKKPTIQEFSATLKRIKRGVTLITHLQRISFGSTKKNQVYIFFENIRYHTMYISIQEIIMKTWVFF